MDKTKIMIIDDEIEILDILAIFLSKDYEVITAENGLEAMEKFLMENPVIIITDINMPYMSGMELLKAVKETSPSTEIIVMTGYRTPEVLLEAQELGAFDCISKPVSIGSLQSLLHRVMDKINLQVVC
jgi:YesN/AraC family two-component response regulator